MSDGNYLTRHVMKATRYNSHKAIKFLVICVVLATCRARSTESISSHLHAEIDSQNVMETKSRHSLDGHIGNIDIDYKQTSRLDDSFQGSSSLSIGGTSPTTAGGSSTILEKIQDILALKNTKTARIFLLFASLAYAANYSTTKYMQEYLPSSILTASRFFLGSLYFIPSIIRTPLNRDIIARAIEIGVYCAIGFTAQAISLQSTASGKVSLFSSLSVVMPPLLDTFVSRQKAAEEGLSPNKRSIGSHIRKLLASPFISPMIAVLGACILEWGGLEAPHLSDVWLLVAPVSFAMALWRSEILAERHPKHALPITGMYLITVGVFCSVWAFYSGDLPLSASPLRAQLINLAFLVFQNKQLLLRMFTTSFLVTAWNSLVEQKALVVVSAAEVTLIYSLEPLFASIYAWMTLGEAITPNLVAGGMFLVAACGWDAVRSRAAMNE